MIVWWLNRMEAEERTAGGIVLPDTAKEKPQRGTVISRRPRQAARQRQARQAVASPSATK